MQLEKNINKEVSSRSSVIETTARTQLKPHARRHANKYTFLPVQLLCAVGRGAQTVGVPCQSLLVVEILGLVTEQRLVVQIYLDNGWHRGEHGHTDPVESEK